MVPSVVNGESTWSPKSSRRSPSMPSKMYDTEAIDEIKNQ